MPAGDRPQRSLLWRWTEGVVLAGGGVLGVQAFAQDYIRLGQAARCRRGSTKMLTARSEAARTEKVKSTNTPEPTTTWARKTAKRDRGRTDRTAGRTEKGRTQAVATAPCIHRPHGLSITG